MTKVKAQMTKEGQRSKVKCQMNNLTFGFLVSLGLWILSFGFLQGCAGNDIFQDIGTNLASPISIVVNPATARAYLVNSNNKVLYRQGSIQAYDITTPTAPVLLGTAPVNGFSGDSFLDPAGYVYTTNRYSLNDQVAEDHIFRINVKDENSADFLTVESFVDGQNPFGLTYDAASNKLYASTSDYSLDYFTLDSSQALPQPIPALSFRNITLSDGSTISQPVFREVAVLGTQAFMTMTSPNSGLLVVDLTGQKADYFVNDLANVRSVYSDGTYIYVTDLEVINDTNTPLLYVFDPTLFTVRAGNADALIAPKVSYTKTSIGVGADGNADPQEILSSTDYIFVTNMGNDSVSVINRAALTKTLADVTVGDEPFGMAVYSPGGVDSYLYVTNIQSNNISIIKLADFSVTTYP